MKGLIQLYRSSKTVFTTRDIAIICGITDLDSLKSRLHYAVKTGKLKALRRGIYTKDENYNPFELATSIYTPAYISLETVLQREGIIFQHYQSIFAVSYLTREIKCAEQVCIFRKIKNQILMDPNGIEQQDHFSIASKERAFLDSLYLYSDYFYDNLKPLDWNKCFELVKLYRQKSLIKKLNLYYKNFKNA